LDVKLAKFGGAAPAGGGAGFFRRAPANPKAMQSFRALNNSFNTMVSMMQVGMDMTPTPTQIATWESDCHNYNRTVTAWNDLQKQQIAAFNTLLAKDNLQQLDVASTKLADPVCSFTSGSSKARVRSGAQRSK
ncbi:MAG: hypothetical protein ACRD8A_19840, partial [Candidatus Acidiferrales bacterium]